MNRGEGRISMGVGVFAKRYILRSFCFLRPKILVGVNTGEIRGVWREKGKSTRIFSGYFED